MKGEGPNKENRNFSKYLNTRHLCRTFAQVMEELKQTGHGEAAQRLAPVGRHFHFEAGGRRAGDGVPSPRSL